MAPKSVTFRRHDHLVSVLFGDLLSHSYNITFSMFLDLDTNTEILSTHVEYLMFSLRLTQWDVVYGSGGMSPLFCSCIPARHTCEQNEC